MIVRIVPIAPVVSKYFETIRTTWAIGSFHMIVSIASKARDAGSSAMSLGQTKEFFGCFANKPRKWMIFIRKANLVPWYLLFLLILRHWEARRVPRRHSISSKSWCHGLSLISNNPHTRCEHLRIIFSASAPSGPHLFSITGIKVMTSGIALDRLSRLRAFPYDRFKIYIGRPDRPDRTQLYPSDRGRLSRPGRLRSFEHFLRRLGQSGRSGRSYASQV